MLPWSLHQLALPLALNVFMTENMQKLVSLRLKFSCVADHVSNIVVVVIVENTCPSTSKLSHIYEDQHILLTCNTIMIVSNIHVGQSPLTLTNLRSGEHHIRLTPVGCRGSAYIWTMKFSVRSNVVGVPSIYDG